MLKNNYQKFIAALLTGFLAIGWTSSVSADAKFKSHTKDQKHYRHDYQHGYDHAQTRGKKYGHKKRGRYGHKHRGYINDPRLYHYNRYDRRYDRRYDSYRRPVLTNCRYIYNRYGERIKRCYPPRYRYADYDHGHYHGYRFHDRYGVYYDSYARGRYKRSHRGKYRSGYYYDSKVGQWIALAILFDRLLD